MRICTRYEVCVYKIEIVFDDECAYTSVLKEDANVIFVGYDARIFRTQNFYPRLVANIRVIGVIAARFVSHHLSQ